MSSNKVILLIIGLFVAGSMVAIAVICSFLIVASSSDVAAIGSERFSTSEGLSLDYKWRKDGFETVMSVDLTFTNNSARSVKDVTVTCTHYAPSGTEIDSNTRTVYKIVPANSKLEVKDFSMGFIHSQVSSTICKIDDFDIN